eukprot:Hpha_TRINITY_DN8980_c0_g1::TRINITY_DN8980_c0_g1_i1::g.81064::m.81064
MNKMSAQREEHRQRDAIEEAWADGVGLVKAQQMQHQCAMEHLGQEQYSHDQEHRESLLLRAFVVLEVYHGESRRQLLERESQRRGGLEAWHSQARLHFGWKRRVESEEWNYRRILVDEEHCIRRTVEASAEQDYLMCQIRPRFRRVLGRDEARARKEVNVCEGSLRWTLWLTAQRERRWALSQEESEGRRRGWVQEQHNMQWLTSERIADMWRILGFQDDLWFIAQTEWSARQRVIDEETRTLMALRGEEVPEWQDLSVLEGDKHALVREEARERRFVREEREWGVRAFDDMADVVRDIVFRFRSLRTDEVRNRDLLVEDEQQGRRDILFQIIQLAHAAARTELSEESAYERFILTKQWTLMKSVIGEHEEQRENTEAQETVSRGKVEGVESEARMKVEDIHSMYLQRFDCEHAKRMLLIDWDAQRRQLEWEEVALRNALLQYRIEALRQPAAARAVGRSVRRAIENEHGFSPQSVHSGGSPWGRSASPSPVVPPPALPGTGEVAEYGALVNRLSEVRNKLRDQVSRRGEDEERRRRESEASGLRTLRLLWQRYDVDTEISAPTPEPLAPVSEQWTAFRRLADRMVRTGTMPADEEGQLERLATDMCFTLGERAGEAAGRLARVHAFLRLLASLRILGRE